ncbi:MAG: glycosyltransferase family 39 protein [Fibromonadales bacterium]|nr:glycosyltransferase family 39 protein [Fibromonadales bacterium]
MKKILREPLFYLLLLLAIVYLAINLSSQKISDVKLTKNNITQNINLPYETSSEGNEVFFISFNLLVKNKNVKYNIIPDNCIEEILINGEKFPLDGIGGICDYQRGAYIDFSKYVKSGLNHFEFRILNHAGPGGLRVETPYSGFKSLSFMHCIFALFFLLSVALILKKLKFRFIPTSIILLGIAVRLVLYTYTGPTQHSYDTGGHLEYVKIIAEENRIPASDESWSAYHPPSYYIASAAIKKIVDLYDPSITNRILQQFSLLLSFGSIIFGVALIIRLLGNCSPAYLAALVSVLWPGFVLAAPRIGNDSLFYFGALFCMFFAQKYWQIHRSSDMILASIGAAIALSAKSTGLIILVIWTIIYIFGSLRFFRIHSLRILLISAFIIVLSLGLSNYRTVIDIYKGKNTGLVGNIRSLNTSMQVKNEIGNYLYFDLKDYLLEPYASTWVDKGGRQYFWTFALKSSLFGEFRLWNSPLGHTLATMLNFLLLFIFIPAIWGLIHFKFKEFPPLLFIAFLFLALAYLRINYPYACSNDFRYIMPVLFPLVYFAVRGTQMLQNSRLKAFSYIAMLAFAGLSLVFIMGMGF